MLHAPVVLRPFATAFAFVLGLLAAWTLAAELIRPSIGYFPATAEDAKKAALQNSAAATAAWSGWPRGDLWADYALTADAGLLAAAAENRTLSANDHAKDVAATAATLAPSDARAWLLLALNAQASNDLKTVMPLKMSYYTSPYSDMLFPLRIRIVSRSSAIADEELASFVEYELGVVIGQKPNLRRYIAAAYRSASLDGRRFFDRALAKLDPKYLAELKSAKP